MTRAINKWSDLHTWTMAATLLVLWSTAVVAQAQPAVVITKNTSSTGFSPDVSQDLILGQSGAPTGPLPQSGYDTITALTDGSAPPSPIGGPPASNFYELQNGNTLTYNLGALASISSIETCTAWLNSGRCDQAYTVDVSADGVNWTTGYITVASQTGDATSPSDVDVVITPASGSLLAADIQYVRFNFPSVQNGWVGYTEIIINGTIGAVYSPPVVTIAPANLIVTNTTTATFTALASGYPAPTLEWHYVDTNNVDNVLPSQNSANLTIPIVSPTDAGSYYVIASNSQGTSNSPMATLTVTNPPNMPVVQTVYSQDFGFDPLDANADLLLGLTAAEEAVPAMTDGSDGGGIPTGPNWSWFGNGQVQTFDLGTLCDISEIDVYSSWLNNGRVFQNYTVSVSSDNGATYTNLYTVAARLSLLYAYAEPADLRVQLTPNVMGALATSVDHVRFSFNNVQNGDVGYMEFMAYGTNVETVGKPVIKTDVRASVTAYQWLPFSLKAVATGNPVPSYQWYFIAGGATNPISGATLPTYSVAQAQFADAGQYQVVIANTEGAVTSAVCAVTVLGTEQITNVVYQDAFGRTGLLNGSTPSPVDTASATWAAWQDLFTDGSELAVTNPIPGVAPSPEYNNAFLPFTPQVGQVYTLSVDIKGTSGGGAWFAMGYAQNALFTNYYGANNIGVGWLLQRADNSEVQVFDGPGVGGVTGGYPGGNSGAFNTYSIVLNTTTGNAASGWTIAFLQNGTQLRQDVYASNPSIAYVGVGSDGVTGDYQNFSLTDNSFQVIEPQLGYQKAGSDLILNWPSIYQGWMLQSNSVGLLDSHAWVTVLDSTVTNQISVTVDHTKSNVFFRLLAP